MINILVTCGGGFQGLTLYKSLKDIKGVKTHLFDINEDNISKYFFDYFSVSIPIKNTEAHIQQLVHYIIQHEIKFIFPATSFDLELLASLKDIFRQKYNCVIATPDINYCHIFKSKPKSYVFLKSNGFPTQKIIDIKKSFDFPLLAKPNEGWGGKGVKLIKNREELDNLEIDNYHFVAYFDNIEEFSIDFSVNHLGVCNTPIIRKRNVVSGGFSVITETTLNFSAYIDRVKNTFSKESLVGVFNLQFIQNCNKEIYFTDLNSRIGTSCVVNNYLGNSILNHFFTQSKASTIGEVKTIRYLSEKYYPKINKDKIKAVVFDLDDTLISNKNFILFRCTLLFDKLKLKKISSEQFKITVLNLLNEGKAPFLLDEIKSIYKLKQSVNEIIDLYRTCYPNQIEVYKDVLSTLEYLKESGYKLFVLTDNPKRTQEKKLQAIHDDVIGKFDSVFFTEDLNTEKPDSICFKTISIKNNIDVSQIVMVGDNEYRDINGALSSGYAYAFHIARKDGMVSHSLMKHSVLRGNSFQIDSLMALKFIL